MVSLLIWRPRVFPLPLGEDEGEGNGTVPLFQVSVEFSSRRTAVVLFAWLAVGLPAGYAMGRYTDTTLSDAGTVIGDGKIVVLEPEKWIGRHFPLLRYIDFGDRLKVGR